MKIKEIKGMILREHVGSGKSPDGKTNFDMSVSMGAPSPILEVDGRYFVAEYQSIIVDLFEFYEKHPKKKGGKA